MKNVHWKYEIRRGRRNVIFCSTDPIPSVREYGGNLGGRRNKGGLREAGRKGPVVEVQTGAERVVRSNVGRCPRARVLIPSSLSPSVPGIILPVVGCVHPRGQLMRQFRRRGTREATLLRILLSFQDISKRKYFCILFASFYFLRENFRNCRKFMEHYYYRLRTYVKVHIFTNTIGVWSVRLAQKFLSFRKEIIDARCRFFFRIILLNYVRSILFYWRNLWIFGRNMQNYVHDPICIIRCKIQPVYIFLYFLLVFYSSILVSHECLYARMHLASPCVSNKCKYNANERKRQTRLSK